MNNLHFPEIIQQVRVTGYVYLIVGWLLLTTNYIGMDDVSGEEKQQQNNVYISY